MYTKTQTHTILGYTLTHVARLWNQRLIEKFRSKGYFSIKPSFLSIFLPLFEAEGKNVAEIAKSSGITKQTISVYVQELKHRGYIKIKRNPDDKRILDIFLTAKGLAFQSVFQTIVQEVSRETFSSLSAIESKQLTVLLVKCASKNHPLLRNQ